MMKGRVYLVGAGCSDADLITVRGQRLIKQAEVIIYDDLIDRSLLSLANADAILVSVGKRGGKKSAKQSEINDLIIDYASQGKTVVRLKGGDPFVFGRGGEEALALIEKDIPFSVVPGVSAGVVIPMEYGIPATHRGIARSLHFITGHTKDTANPLPEGLPELAKLHGTLVFYMGISHLKDIAQGLIQHGKDSDTGCAVVSGGNSENPFCVRSTLSNIYEDATNAKVQSPALIVVGEVTKMDLLDLNALPLSGKRVGLTGTDSFCDRLRERLWEVGAKPVQIQKGTCSLTKEKICWDKITDKNLKWLVFLSANGVRTFFDRMKKDHIDIRNLSNTKLAVIGEATGNLLKEYGFTADLCPAIYTKEDLTEELIRTAREEEIILLDSLQGSDDMRDTLIKNGCKASRVSIYSTEYVIEKDVLPPDFIIFGSAGAVKALHKDGYTLDKKTEPICIGPVAKKAFCDCYGYEPNVPDKITSDSIVQKLIQLI